MTFRSFFPGNFAPGDDADVSGEGLLRPTWDGFVTRRADPCEGAPDLFTFVRNLHIDRCRRAQLVAFESLDDEDALAEPAGDIGDGSGVNGDLEALLGTRRDSEREVLFLHYVQGHTAEEIGALTGRPRGTVLSLMSRAVARLRARAEANPNNFRNRMILWFVSFL